MFRNITTDIEKWEGTDGGRVEGVEEGMTGEEGWRLGKKGGQR